MSLKDDLLKDSTEETTFIDDNTDITISIAPDEDEPVIEPDNVPTAEGFIDACPCNWVLSADGDNIMGINSVSKESFKGTMIEFNAKLRG